MVLVEKIAHKTIEFSFYALFFLTPLLWNPNNSELFELPKMFFVWAITIVIAGAWAARSVINGRFLFRRTPLDIPLLCFLVFQFLSFLVSIDHHTSLWGYYSRFNGGLLSLIAYCILYWSLVSNMDLKKSLFTIHLSLITATLVAIYAIPAHFGYDLTCYVLGRGITTDCWSAQFVPTERIFGTFGQPNWLAAWLVALVPLTVSLALSSKVKTQKLKLQLKSQKFLDLHFRFALYTLSFALLLLAIIFTRSDSGFLGLASAAAVFTIGYFWKKLRPRAWFYITVITIIMIILALPRVSSVDRCIRILTTNYVLHSADITPSADIRCIVWKGAIDIWRYYPTFGSGPETFAYTYYNFKPPEQSLTSEWDFLYNKAHNEYLNYLANTGILGLASHLFLIFASIRIFIFVLNSHNKLIPLPQTKLLVLGLLSGYCSMLITNFFGFSVVPVQLLFFLFPALALTLTTQESDQRKSAINPRKSVIIFGVLLILFSTFYILNSIFRFYIADIHYSNSQKLASDNDYLNSLTAIRKTIEVRPTEPSYQNALSDIASSIAFLTYEQDATLSAQLANLTENASDRALAISPRNITTLKIRSNVFITLAQLDPSYMDKAREALEEASRLAPTDARIAFNLGLLYWQTEKIGEAKAQFEKALSLRPNYSDAQTALEELNKKTK
ncbi:O-antigen ligase family protein [Candidatus Microgenomates bacterium]|nr:O-antigen ligase family protein [Candidatus Microgenomates bacterium]